MDKGKAQGIGCITVIGVLGLVWVVSLFGEPEPEFIAMNGLDNYAMILPPEAAPAAIEASAKAKCASKQICSVMGWTDEAQAGRALPLLDREVATLAFDYRLNRTTGFERALWDCARFPQSDASHCLSN